MNTTHLLNQLESVLPILIGGGITCVVTAFTLIPALFLLYRLFKGAQKRKALLGNGIPAPAQILGTQDTGVTVNDHPRIVVQLQVHPPDGESYTTTVTSVVSRLQASSFHNGALVQVRYSPADRNQVTIVGPLGEVKVYAPEGGVAPPLLPTLHRLLQAQMLHESVAASGQEMTGEVVSCQHIGMFAGGKNPFMAFEISVFHPTEGRFRTKTEGVISQLSVDKYGKGCSVVVKVDPLDRERVSIIRSA